MTWLKVDDSFHSHPKVLAATPAALGLWVVAGSWSGANLSDGFVPDHVLPRLLPDGALLAQQLVSAGLWRRARGGYRFHDWADYNPKREDVEEERRQARERMRNLRSSRKTAGQGRDGSGEQPANVRAKFVTPTRPDPNPLKGGSGSGVRPSDGTDPPNPDWRTMPAYGQAEPLRETPARAAARAAAERARRPRTPGRDAFAELRLVPTEHSTEETA